MSESDRSIMFQGRVEDGLGIALWQADGSGPEPAAVGHRFATPIGTITAHYYVASRERVDSTARGGLVTTAIGRAWPRVRGALEKQQFALADLIICLPLTTAGADREGEDWFYRDGVETRYMRPQAPLPLLLKTKTLLEFAPPRLVLTEDYRGARGFAEVRLSLASEPTRVQPASAPLTDAERKLVDAFLADIGSRSVRFLVDAIHLTPLTFAGQGRTSGRYAEIPAARLEVV